MADYAIGDIQGCYTPFMRLLEHIQFDDASDRLWLVGDLINRGPNSLEVLRFIQSLQTPAYITLGNHDLHLLSLIFLNQPESSEDTLSAILNAPDKLSLAHWLKSQPLLIHDETLNIVMTHAGIPPTWTLEQAKQRAHMLEQALRGEYFLDFFKHMYGNTPVSFESGQPTQDNLRVICNYFTRMRFCTKTGALELKVKTKPENAPDNIYPWYALPNRVTIKPDILFGHWAALEGRCPVKGIYALDTGCVWGGQLTALRLQDKKRFFVSAE